MKRAITGLAVGVAVFASAFGTTVYAQPGEPSGSSTQPDQEVQDRAVPRMGVPNEQFQQVRPLQPVQPFPRARQGFVRQGNTIVAQPGYVLEPGPNNQVTARIAGGSAGGQGATTTSCQCVHDNIVVAFETCTTTVIGTSATCTKGSGTCQSSCAWTTTTTGLSRGGKAMQ